MMVDTGAAVTIMTEKWATAYGLRIMLGKNIQIRGGGGANVKTLGTTTFTVQVSPTLELDLSDVVVSVGVFHQALIGGDILVGKPGVLGSARIIMLSLTAVGNIQWR
jgi:predicted aspartyl protease